jgi:hypothetical protein
LEATREYLLSGYPLDLCTVFLDWGKGVCAIQPAVQVLQVMAHPIRSMEPYASGEAGPKEIEFEVN